MSKVQVGRPPASEYAEYYERYVGLIPGADIVDVLERQLPATLSLLAAIDEAKGNYRYAPGKWTVKDLLGHVIDTERVFAYRALVFSRNDRASLPGFDQDVWVEHAYYANLSIADIAKEFEAVRRATVSQLRHLDAAAWNRVGTGNNKEMTTRAAAYVIAGHLEHHVSILKSRYLDT